MMVRLVKSYKMKINSEWVWMSERDERYSESKKKLECILKERERESVCVCLCVYAYACVLVK